MKKYLPLIVVAILIVSGVGAVAGIDSEKEKFTFDTVELSQLIIEEKRDYVRVNFPEATSNTWEKDKPTLPALTKVYTYPLGTEIIDVDVSLDRENKGILISSEVRLEGKTGAEMEALTAVSVAALTVYDMCKAVDKNIIIENIRLLEKDGGKSGHFIGKKD